MTYKARYIPLKQGDTAPKPYYRTITSADSLNDAIRQAERLTRKGYICKGVVCTYQYG